MLRPRGSFPSGSSKENKKATTTTKNKAVFRGMNHCAVDFNFVLTNPTTISFSQRSGSFSISKSFQEITPGTFHATQASHAARGPKPPLDTEPVEANRHGEEGGDNRRERGGGEAASVETSLEDILPLLHEKLERTRLMGLDLQRRCCARLSEGKIARLSLPL